MDSLQAQADFAQVELVGRSLRSYLTALENTAKKLEQNIIAVQAELDLTIASAERFRQTITESNPG